MEIRGNRGCLAKESGRLHSKATTYSVNIHTSNCNYNQYIEIIEFIKKGEIKMSFKIYNKKNCVTTHQYEYTFRVTKYGHCTFSKSVLELMGLNGGDKINILNEDGTNNWYITKVKDESGFEICKLSTRLYGFRNILFSDLLLKSLKLTDSASFPICKQHVIIEGTSCFQLKTARPKAKRKKDNISKINITAEVDNEKCAKVIACTNHDANAIANHAANYPDTL